MNKYCISKIVCKRMWSFSYCCGPLWLANVDHGVGSMFYHGNRETAADLNNWKLYCLLIASRCLDFENCREIIV